MEFVASGVVEQDGLDVVETVIQPSSITAEQLQAIGIVKPLAVQLAEKKAKEEEERSIPFISCFDSTHHIHI